MQELSLADLEHKLIELLETQALPADEIRLIGLLGKGTRAVVFSVIVDGVYHVLKVYDSAASMKAELRNLRKMTPKDRFLFSWQEDNLNLAIIEVPEGRELTSDLLTPTVSTNLAKRLAELYRIRYRQRVSQSSLLERLERSNGPCLEAVQALGLDVAPYEKLLKGLEKLLRDEPKLFRTNKVRVHGDLWWPNIMVAEEDVYLIDWESMHRGDPAEDLAKFRLVTYWPRNEIAPTYFWQHPSHVPRISRALASIVEHYNTSVGNDDLSKRLRFYLPFLCVYELGLRYTMVQTESAFSTMTDRILATEALRLFEDPLAYPPDLKAIGYAALLDEAMAAS